MAPVETSAILRKAARCLLHFVTLAINGDFEQAEQVDVAVAAFGHIKDSHESLVSRVVRLFAAFEMAFYREACLHVAALAVASAGERHRKNLSLAVLAVTLEQLDGLAARNLGGSACGRHCLSFVSHSDWCSRTPLVAGLG